VVGGRSWERQVRSLVRKRQTREPKFLEDAIGRAEVTSMIYGLCRLTVVILG